MHQFERWHVEKYEMRIAILNCLSFYAQVVLDKELWISSSRFNGLFRINIESNEITFIGRFPQHNVGDAELHLFAKKYGDKIYFFPKCSKSIDIYDLKTGKFTSVVCSANRLNRYVTAIDAFLLDKDTLLIVPCYSGMPLQEFSIRKEEIIRSTELKETNQYVKNEANTMSLYACKVQDEIFYPIHGTNRIGSYNFKKKTEKIYLLKGLKKILGDIVYDGSDLWINADQGIYQWKPYNNSLKLICDCSSEKEGWIEQFILYKQELIGIPRWLNKIKIIDRSDFSLKEVYIDKFFLSKNQDMSWRDVRESFVWRDKLVISPIKYKEAIYIDLNNYKIECKKYESPEISFLENFFSYEKKEEDLREYFIMVNESIGDISEKNDRHVGHNILQEIK